MRKYIPGSKRQTILAIFTMANTSVPIVLVNNKRHVEVSNKTNGINHFNAVDKYFLKDSSIDKALRKFLFVFVLIISYFCELFNYCVLLLTANQYLSAERPFRGARRSFLDAFDKRVVAITVQYR